VTVNTFATGAGELTALGAPPLQDLGAVFQKTASGQRTKTKEAGGRKRKGWKEKRRTWKE